MLPNRFLLGKHNKALIFVQNQEFLYGDLYSLTNYRNMKIFYLLFCGLIFSVNTYSQSAIGTWKTIDDEEGTVKSYVSIYEENGKLYGEVKKLINPEKTTCSACKGDKKDKPIEGMQIMWDLEASEGNKWQGGKILDPKNGKEYKCKIELEDANTLKVRGFIGFSLLGRTQVWYRIEE
jgi:uncharacterized protein (DUF2147 family)